MSERYFENVSVGDKTESGTYTFTEQEIMDYCRKYDPQLFHIDRQEAQRSMFGTLVASGLHTLAVSFTLFMETGLFGNSNLGGFGMDEVRLIRPVKGGDTIHVRSEVIEARPSESRPDRGVVRVRHEVVNQDNVIVTTFIVGHLVRRRPA
jgi:acyl dehydratase